MRKRDRLKCWKQLLSLVGVCSLTEDEWANIYLRYRRSWNRTYYIKLDEDALPAVDVNQLIEHYLTAPQTNVASKSGCFVNPPSSGPSVGRIKRRNSRAPQSAFSSNNIKRRSSLISPIAPSASLAKRRNTLGVSPSAAPKIVKLGNSVAANDIDAIHHIKRSDSVIPAFETFDCDAFTSPIKLRDSMALEQWMEPIKIISPLANSPVLCGDSPPGSDLEINYNKSDFPWTPSRIKRRDSSVTSRPRLKSKNSMRRIVPQSISVVKHVTGSGDELDDEMSLSTWKDYIAHRKALNTKPLGIPENAISKEKCPKYIKVEPPVKRKRGRPSRQEKAKRLEEEQALQKIKAVHGAKKLQKINSQSKNISSSAQPPKPPKQKPTAKPISQLTSLDSKQEGADIAVHSKDVVQPAILDDDAIPPAHMPVRAINLKSSSQDPLEEGEMEDKQSEGTKEMDLVRPMSSSTANGIIKKNGLSKQSKIFLGSDEEEDEQLLIKQTGFVLNDLEAEERLLNDAMDLTSPVGGGEGNKDTMEIDIDLDLLLRDDNVANQIALIDTQPSTSFDQCLNPKDTQPANEKSAQCLEPLSPKRAPSPIDQQLPHALQFFKELSSRPSVNVNADKTDLQWPFMDEDEVLDYEEDYDVLTLAVSSDELEDECVIKSKGESKPQSQVNKPKTQVRTPKPELQQKPINKPENQTPENVRNFRIPKLNPELLKAQPSVMHTLYLQEEEQNREITKPVTPNLTEDMRKSRKEARAARRPKETIPRFAPPYRPTREESVNKDSSQPLLGPQDLAAPIFGPDDLGPVFIPLSNREESNYRHPHTALPYAPEPLNSYAVPLNNGNLLPTVPNQRHPCGASQYVPQNLATSERNTRLAEQSSSSHQGIGVKNWMMEIFGAKCLNYLDNNCLAANCNHTMSTVGEVEKRLLSMSEETLTNTYRKALRSFHIFERYFKCFANIFERRKLGKHLLQMLANSRLYRNLTVSILGHVFPALKRCGLEREATACMMTDLWLPDKAHKFTDLTLAILKILEAGNWQDYIDKLVELHETYKFLLSDEFMIRILKWADVNKNEPLQKKAMMMLLADLATYSRSPTLMSIVGRFANPDPNPNVQQQRTAPVPALSRGSPAQQYAPPNWNQSQNLNPQQDRLPGAVASSSLIRRSPVNGQLPQYQAANWNHNPNLVPPHERLPGAVPGLSLIRSNTALTPHWNQNGSLPGAGPSLSLIQSSPLAGQQEFQASNWRSQAENLTRANDNTLHFQ